MSDRHGLSEARHTPCLMIVAGPGRSGTSLLTGLMGRVGFYVPQPEIGADATNPKGFGEPTWALAFHKRLMSAAGISHGDTRPEAIDLAARAAASVAVGHELVEWLGDQFHISDRVVVKDPRLVWFADSYRAAAAELGVEFGVLTMLRHPAEAIRSANMAYGGGLPVTTRAAGWINGALAIERTTRTMPRAVVYYDDLMNDWRGTLDAVVERLPMQLTGRATAAQLADADDLLDVSLRRSHPDWTGLGVLAPLQALAMRLFEALYTFTDTHPDGCERVAAAFRQLDKLKDAYAIEYQCAQDMVWSSIDAARTTERRRVLRELEQTEATRSPAARFTGSQVLSRARRLARRSG